MRSTETFAAVQATPAANAAGWHNTDVSLSFSFADPSSGVETIMPSRPNPITSEGAGQVVTATAIDHAGNVSSPAETTLSIDKTKPVITYTLSSLPNGNGWYNQPVTVSFAATDALSGLLSLTPSAPVTVSADGTATITATAIDVAGNVSTLPVTIRMDRTSPTVTCGTVSGGLLWPPNHKMVPWHTFVHVTDATSGPDTFKLFNYKSSEPDNARRGDGNTTNDMLG